MSDDIFRSVEAFSSDDEYPFSGSGRDTALLDDQENDTQMRTQPTLKSSARNRAKSGVSQRSARVERKLSKRKEEGKDNPKLGVTWYLVYCVFKAGLLILTSLLFSMNNHPHDPTKNLTPF